MKKFTSLLLLLLSITTLVHAQTLPVWWFGGSAAADPEKYTSHLQQLNSTTTTLLPFTKGSTVGYYVSGLVEYKPNHTVGVDLNVSYNASNNAPYNRVTDLCGCYADLKTSISYVGIEPSVRLNPFSIPLYFNVGAMAYFNVNHSFYYKEHYTPPVSGNLSNFKNSQYGAQIGAGYDIPLSYKNDRTQVVLAPFVAFLPNVDQPRTVENLSINTFRAGFIIKFGRTKVKPIPPVVPIIFPTLASEPDVNFTITSPPITSNKNESIETFPLRNYIFINNGFTDIPNRYILLSKEQAVKFKEKTLLEQIQNETRSQKQLIIYHNILNIIGDRLRLNPSANLLLIGASAKSLKEGKVFTSHIKDYLVNVYGISTERITVQERFKPIVPSEHPGGVKQLDLIRTEDRRVDVESTTPEILTEVDTRVTKADSTDKDNVTISVDKPDLIKYYYLSVADEEGTQAYYGSFTNQGVVPVEQILTDCKAKEGSFRLTISGETKSGKKLHKDTTVYLYSHHERQIKSLRYSVIFDFDKYHNANTYEAFLNNVVAPNIPYNATVTIQGHTDIVGGIKHNQTLSENRAQSVKKVLEKALLNRYIGGVTFIVKAYGEDTTKAEFGNTLPEERFYNRTVTIDIVPEETDDDK